MPLVRHPHMNAYAAYEVARTFRHTHTGTDTGTREAAESVHGGGRRFNNGQKCLRSGALSIF